jgi:integrase
MARQIGKLTALQIRRAKPGWHNDGGGLYLRADKGGGRYWFFRWAKGGSKYLALGPEHTITLTRAREKARACRELLVDGRDPKKERAAATLEAQRQASFSEVASRYFEAHKPAWSQKHAEDWHSTVQRYAEPVLGALPVTGIDTGLVLKVLEPLWTVKTQTASRLRGRIEAVLDFAKSRGLRDGDNPARWRGHLDNLLPGVRKLALPKHHAALPYADVPAFVAELRKFPGTPARCLEFLILTAARTAEARCAVWEEISSGGDVWTIPAARMKTRKSHRIPLSRAARKVLDKMRKERRGPHVFAGIHSASLINLLWKLRANTTVHGFRSSFRDWVAEETNFSGEVAEMALAHAVASAVEAAYRRGDMLEARRKLMEAWGNYCSGVKGGVVPIRQIDPAADTESGASEIRLVRIPDAMCRHG